MLVKCSWCQKTFNSERYGRQYCTHCGAELDVPVPGAQEAAPEPTTVRPGEGDAPTPVSAERPGEPQAQDPWAQPHEPGPQAGGAPWAGQQQPSGGGPQWGAGGGSGALPPGSWGGWGFGSDDGPPQDQPAPWDRRGELGNWPALVETWKQASLDPKRFFARLQPTGIAEAFLYAWILTTAGTVIGSLWGLPFMETFGLDATSLWAQVVLAPILTALGLFLQAGILHLVCMMLGCASRGFDGTFRVVAYAQGPAILNILPGVGGIASTVWSAVLMIHGIAAMHRTTTGKATLAIILPGLLIILCCGCVAALGIAGLGAAANDITTF